MKNLEGIIPYLVSPVNSDGSVKTETLTRLCDDLITEGVHGLCVLGSVGEFPYLTAKQKQVIVQTVVRAAHGRVPVIAGVAGYSTAQACEEALAFASFGVDALVVMLEYYFPLDADQVAGFYRDVATVVPDCPIIIYSNPKYMHCDIPFEVFERLTDVPNILYYKDAFGNTGRLLTLRNRFGDRFKLFSASAHVPLFVSMLGGVGWMAGPACLVPSQCLLLHELYRNKEMDRAMDLQTKLWEINRVFAKYDLAACVKAGLQHLGYPVGIPVPPLRPLSSAGEKEICSLIDTIRSIR